MKEFFENLLSFETFEKLLNKPSHFEDFLFISKAYRNEKRYDEAISNLNMMNSLYPGKWQYHHELGQIYCLKGNFD